MTIQKFIDEARARNEPAEIYGNGMIHIMCNDLTKVCKMLEVLSGAVNKSREIGDKGMPLEFDNWLTSHDIIAKINKDALEQCERIIGENDGK